MKILFNIPSVTGVGGLEKVTSAKANWLVDNGYEVVMVTINQGGMPPAFALDPRIKHIDLGVNYLYDSKSLLLKMTLRLFFKAEHRMRLKKVLFDEKPDITVMTGTDIGYDIKDGSKKISENHTARLYRIKASENNPLRRIVGKFLIWNKKRLSKKYDAFVCLTEEDKTDWGSDITNITAIPNSIKHTREPLASLQNRQAIAVGRLVYIKRFDRLIAAWEHVYKAHPDWTLKIYGDGPLKEPLNRLIAEKGLGNAVKICEPTKEIMSVYRKSSVMVSTSACEGFHMGMLEAMSCGLPIVSFDYKCGPRTLIDDGESGFIVPEDDTKGLADKICQVIEDDELRKSMGKKSYEKSLLFTEDAVMHRWEALFVELCEK